MTLYKGNKVIAGSRSYIGNIGDIKYTTRVDLPFGGSWCDGSIKLKAQFPTVYQMLIDGKLQALDIATYESALNLNGSCGFFGLDTATESFRVPSLNDVYIKSGQEADEFGAESLPNITANWNSAQYDGGWGTPEGAVYGIKNNSPEYNSGSLGMRAYFDASKSSSTYQDGAKVNPDHVKYRAYVVLYTGADTNIDITKEIQLNNPFSFGMSQWFESDPKNASWLKSDGAFHSGAVYESFYNWLVSEYENPDKLPKKVNADIVGNPTISDGVASGFSASDYLVLPETFMPESNSWEIGCKFTTGSSFVESGIITKTHSGQQYNYGLRIAITASAKMYYLIGSSSSAFICEGSGSHTLTQNTTYCVKFEFTGDKYTAYIKTEDGEWELDYTFSSATPMESFGEPTYIGTNFYKKTSFNGSINLKETYIKIDNKLWWEFLRGCVKTPNDLYSDYDYVINTESNSFRLPVKTHLASGNAVVGNGNPVYLTANQTGRSDYPITNNTSVGVNISTSISNANGDTLGITTDPQYSGIETSSNGLKLYFYVGETVQDANLINASKVLDLLAKLESYDYVVESKTPTAEDPTWYRVYKSGWVEQGGISSSASRTATLTVAMANINYSVSCIQRGTSGPTSAEGSPRAGAISTTQIFVNGGAASNDVYWEVKGQGA